MTWEWSLKCVIIKLINNVESLGLVYHPLNVPGKDNKTGLILDTTLYYGQFWFSGWNNITEPFPWCFFLIQGLRILARFRLLLQMILLTTEWARSYLPLDKSHRSDSGMILWTASRTISLLSVVTSQWWEHQMLFLIMAEILGQEITCMWVSWNL